MLFLTEISFWDWAMGHGPGLWVLVLGLGPWAQLWAKSGVQDSQGDPDLGDSQWSNQSKLSAGPAQACQEIPMVLRIQGAAAFGGRPPVLSMELVFLGRLVLVMHSTLTG